MLGSFSPEMQSAATNAATNSDLFLYAAQTASIYLRPKNPLADIWIGGLGQGGNGSGNGGGGNGNKPNNPPATPRNTTLPDLQSPTGDSLVQMPDSDVMVYQNPTSGNVVISIRRLSPYMSAVSSSDMAEISRTGEQIFQLLKSMSRGPYKTADLRRMGHPYGLDNAKPRKVPRRNDGKSIGHPKGIRGSAPTLDIINLQDGLLERSWRWNWTRDASGISLNFWNTARSKDGFNYPAALAFGTEIMQQHGPWHSAAARLLPLINSQFHALNRKAYHRQQALDGIGAIAGVI